MKKLVLFFFLTSFYSFSQDTLQTPISKVQVKSDNILFRGIENEIFINVPNPETLVASTVGLKIRNGRFFIAPTSGTELKLNLTFKNSDGKLVTEYHYFKIKNLPKPIGTINNEYATKGYLEFTKAELKDAIIRTKLVDFPIANFPQTESFVIVYEMKEIKIIGDSLNSNAMYFINTLHKDSFFIIKDISFPMVGMRAVPTKEIKIKLLD